MHTEIQYRNSEGGRMKKRNLLIDEYPLLVLPSLAKAIGLNEAIALQQLHYWLENPKGGIEIDGFRWVYNTYEEWQKDNFLFWSVRTVQRVFTSLESQGLVISMQKAAYDRKKYYRIHYDKLALLNETDCLNPEFQNGTMEGDNMASSLTETTADIKTETMPENMPIDWKILHGEEITQKDVDYSKTNEEAPRMFENAFGFGKLPWDSNKTWETFRKFVTDIYRKDRMAFGNYIIWRGNDGKYKAMNNKQIRMNPQVFMDTGWAEFHSVVSKVVDVADNFVEELEARRQRLQEQMR